MKFWDTSALVPLIIDEPATAPVRAVLTQDPDVLVWTLTGVELLSTLGRLGRTSSGLADLLPGVRYDVMALFARWAAVTDVEGVERRAERLVGVHPLNAADALQLGALLQQCMSLTPADGTGHPRVWSDDVPAPTRACPEIDILRRPSSRCSRPAPASARMK